MGNDRKALYIFSMAIVFNSENQRLLKGVDYKAPFPELLNICNKE